MVLLLKNLLFTLVVPGLLGVWVPVHIFADRPWWPEEGMNALSWLGLLLLAIGAAGYLHCLWLFGSYGRGTPAAIDPPRKLVQRGLYRHVRNPMYLAVLTFVAGQAVFLASWQVGIYWLCLACCFQLFVHLHEEPDLTSRFGAMYVDYQRDVPRWFPQRRR